MSLKDELDTYVHDVLYGKWETRDGQKVPDTDDISLKNVAVKLDATILYADLAESTSLVESYKWWFAAEIYKTYLYCATKTIRAHQGVITAYDGDRVMAVFIGGSKNTNAAKAALKINYTVKKIIQPKLHERYENNKYVLKQRVGVATSEVKVARTGIRGSNDLVWVGKAANRAAKMAALTKAYASFITADVYNMLHEDAKFGGNPKRNMWTDLGHVADAGSKVYGSTWHWGV